MTRALILAPLLAGCAQLVGISDSTDLALVDLGVSRGALSPAFSPDVMHYTLALPYTAGDVAFTATAADPTVAIDISGEAVLPAHAYGVTVPVGATTVEITARATSGVAVTYTVEVARADFALALAAPVPVTGSGMIDALRTGDLDGDGRDDLVYATYDGAIGVLVAGGGRAFTAHGPWPVGHVRDFAVGDVVGDARPDVVATSGSTWVLAGLGGGELMAPFGIGMADPGAITVGRLDGDARGDAVVVDGPGHVTAMMGQQDTLAWGQVWPMTAGASGQPRVVRLADIDDSPGDEVVALDTDAHAISILHGDFHTGIDSVPLVLGDAPAELVALDLDADHRADLAWLDPVANAVVVQRAPGWTRTAVALHAGAPHGLVAGDLDGDGAADLVVLDGDDVIALRNDGAGGFLVRRIPHVAGNAVAMAIGDFDHDGRGDLAFAHTTSTLTVAFGVAP